MRLRLHEIELGTSNTEQSSKFYQQVLQLDVQVQNPQLNVFNAGTDGLDFNTSAHLPPGTTCISFLTGNLTQHIERLKQLQVPFEGPQAAHLGMQCIQFQDPDGNLVKINAPTEASPEWLKV